MNGKTKTPPNRLMVLSGAAYIAILLGVIVYGAIAFSDLYTAPADVQRSGFPANVPLAPGYLTFLTWSGVALGLYLSVWSAILGVLRKSLLQGVVSLAAGGLLTMLGLSLLPSIYYPFDQYSPAAGWLFLSVVLLPLGFGFMTVLGRIWTRRRIGSMV